MHRTEGSFPLSASRGPCAGLEAVRSPPSGSHNPAPAAPRSRGSVAPAGPSSWDRVPCPTPGRGPALAPSRSRLDEKRPQPVGTSAREPRRVSRF